jgi:hypothetical protein
MGFEQQIEKMKREYTDKYVVVDAARPELARFRDAVGRVKTVNMSGRALVEFDDYHLNIGWYDIDPEFLKVVDKPPPKEKKAEAKKPAAKPAAGEATSAAAKTSPKPAAPKGGKMSVAEMLAAAKAGGAAKPAGAAPAKAKAETAPAADKPAAPKVDRSKMSVADMLAAARAGGAAGSAPGKPAAPAKPKPAPEPVAEKEEAPAAPVVEKKAPTPKSSEKIDKSKMSIDDMIAWCREHDAKS